jgi:serine protease Do
MPVSNIPPASMRRSIGRRIARLASVAGLGMSALLGSSAIPNSYGLATMALAQSVQQPASFADVVDKVKSSVVSVRTKQSSVDRTREFQGQSPFEQGSPLDRFFRRFGMPDEFSPDQSRRPRRDFSAGQGSGFFISADGYVVTNNHVVDKAQSLEVVTDEGKTLTARVIGADPRTDLALLKVEGSGNFPYVRFSERAPRVGDWVVAVGNPFGLGGTVTAGIVSARGRDIGAGPYDDFLQIDAPVNRGNSGGPTFDTNGNVIGVNTAIFSPSGGSVGIAFAVPAETANAVITQLRDKGTVTRGWIGVQIQPVTPDLAEGLGMKTVQGALVVEPQPGGPAAKAGINAGDVITKVNNAVVADARDLARQIGSAPPGTTVRLTILRSGGEHTINLVLGELPNDREARMEGSTNQRGTSVPTLGLTLTPGSNGDGVVISNVDVNGAAAEQGFKSGDIIYEVGGRKVSNPAEVQSAVQDARRDGKRSVIMRVRSGDSLRYVALRLSRA